MRLKTPMILRIIPVLVCLGLFCNNTTTPVFASDIPEGFPSRIILRRISHSGNSPWIVSPSGIIICYVPTDRLDVNIDTIMLSRSSQLETRSLYDLLRGKGQSGTFHYAYVTFGGGEQKLGSCSKKEFEREPAFPTWDQVRRTLSFAYSIEVR